MNLFLTKISRSYVKGVMRYLSPPLVSDVGTKTLGNRRLKFGDDQLNRFLRYLTKTLGGEGHFGSPTSPNRV